VFCVSTAVVFGFMVGAVAPRMLIGSITRRGNATTLPADVLMPEKIAATGTTASAVLPVAERLNLDPREEQSSTVRWSGLDESRRHEILQRYWQFVEQPSEEQTRQLAQYQAFRSLPEERQAFLRERARRLSEFMATLSAQDIAVLKGMDDRQRAERLLELWQARYGKW